MGRDHADQGHAGAHAAEAGAEGEIAGWEAHTFTNIPNIIQYSRRNRIE